MAQVRIEETVPGVCLHTPAWRIEHLRAAGGAWHALVFAKSSGGNFLRAPLTSAIWVLDSQAGAPVAYYERNEKAPRLRVEETPEGFPAVVAEGVYHDGAGRTLPVGYRRRTEYHDYGLLWTTLEIMSESGCPGVVEVCALELPLRAGPADCFARFHPTQAGGADLLGGRGWYPLRRPGTPFLSRFTPLQFRLEERGGEGLELFPGSELAQWDCQVKPDAGLGRYEISQNGEGATVALSPYSLVARRGAVKIQGTLCFRLGIGLPCPKPGPRTQPQAALITVAGGWKSRTELAGLAASGAKVLCFRDDYRDGGVFWRNGVYPPYDEAGMRSLKELLEAAHAEGLKVVPHLSLKELHPEAPQFKKSAREWMHLAAPSLEIVHNWAGADERGGLMCLKSGWFDSLKTSLETILAALPWDGLCLDCVEPHPCCHSGHGRGPYHSDLEQVLAFLLACRKRVGDECLLYARLNGTPLLVAENIAAVWPREADKCRMMNDE
jgi:hypothetical protein